MQGRLIDGGAHSSKPQKPVTSAPASPLHTSTKPPVHKVHSHAPLPRHTDTPATTSKPKPTSSPTGSADAIERRMATQSSPKPPAKPNRRNEGVSSASNKPKPKPSSLTTGSADSFERRVATRASVRITGSADTLERRAAARSSVRVTSSADSFERRLTARSSIRLTGSADSLDRRIVARSSVRYTGSADAFERRVASQYSAKPAKPVSTTSADAIERRAVTRSSIRYTGSADSLERRLTARSSIRLTGSADSLERRVATQSSTRYTGSADTFERRARSSVRTTSTTDRIERDFERRTVNRSLVKSASDCPAWSLPPDGKDWRAKKYNLPGGIEIEIGKAEVKGGVGKISGTQCDANIPSYGSVKGITIRVPIDSDDPVGRILPFIPAPFPPPIAVRAIQAIADPEINLSALSGEAGIYNDKEKFRAGFGVNLGSSDQKVALGGQPGNEITYGVGYGAGGGVEIYPGRDSDGDGYREYGGNIGAKIPYGGNIGIKVEPGYWYNQSKPAIKMGKEALVSTGKEVLNKGKDVAVSAGEKVARGAAAVVTKINPFSW